MPSYDGLLMYRNRGEIQVLLAHPGGPLFLKKDEAPGPSQGEPEPGEELLAAARREFDEETLLCPRRPFASLKPIRQKSGKLVHAWAFAGDCDPATIKSNTFTMEWPPKSGGCKSSPRWTGPSSSTSVPPDERSTRLRRRCSMSWRRC